jgi:L-fuculose-phosphate aldolase
MLDDFAQIAGRKALTAKSLSPRDVAAALGRRQGVLLPGIGALCGAHTQSDANAVRLVIEKNALAQVYAESFGKLRPIPAAECALMRFVYKYSYSKRKRKKCPSTASANTAG